MKTHLSALAVLLSLLAGGRMAAQEQPLPQPLATAADSLTTVQAVPAQQAVQTAALQQLGQPAMQPIGQPAAQQSVLPAVAQPATIVESATYYGAAPQMDRAERRRLRGQEFAARIDSLVRSNRYCFRAHTMRELPDGAEHRLYADFYHCALAADHVELYLPVEQSAARFVEVLNFDSMSVRDYRASRLQGGWNITFAVLHDDALYRVDLSISTLTGEAQLTLLAPHVAVRYTGALLP